MAITEDAIASGAPAPRAAQGLSTTRKILYSVVQLGNGSIDFIIAVYLLKYYTDFAGLAPESAGLALLLGKAFDAVTDPIMGNLTDRTRTRWGRRRPYLLIGVVPLAVGFVAMFSPDPAWSQTRLFIWLAVTNTLFYTGSTILDVPHAALGSELTHDHRDRISLMGWRTAFSSMGLLIGAVSPGLWIDRREQAAMAIAEAQGLAAEAVTTAGTAAMMVAHRQVAIVFGVLLLGAALVSFFGTRERVVGQTPPRASIFDNILDTFRSNAFLLFLVIFIIEQVGTRFTVSLALYAFNDWWAFPRSLNSPLLFGYLAMGLLSIPVWVRVGRSREKTHIFLAGSIITTVALCLMLLVPSIGMWWGFATLALAGSGFGARSVMGISLMGDIIDDDEYRTKTRKDGAYFGTWMLVRKLTQSLTLGIIGLGLGMVGYVKGGGPQPQSAVDGIKWMFTLMPAVLILGGALLFLWFPVNRASHAAGLDAVAKRKADRDSG